MSPMTFRRRTLPAIALLLLASPVLSQPVTYTGTFFIHQYGSSTGGGYKGSSDKSTFTSPFSQSDGAGSYVGSIEVTYPATLPPATVDASGQYLSFTQAVSTRYKVSLTWTRRSTKDTDNFASELDISTESNTAGRPLPTCAKQIPLEYFKGPGSKTYEVTLDCTWNKFAIGNAIGNEVPGTPMSFLLNDVDFLAAAPDYLGGVGIQVYTTYQFYAPIDLMVDHIEVAQVTQKADNSIALVGGKPTMVRVFVSLGDKPAPPTADVTAVLRGSRGGSPLAGSPLRPKNGSITVPNVAQRDNPDHSLNFILPEAWTQPGSIRLTAEIDPDHAKQEQRTDNNTKDIDVSFGESHAFLINYLRVCHTWPDPSDPSGFRTRCPSDAITRAHEKLKRLYPIADSDVLYLPLKTPQWTWTRPLVTEADMGPLIVALRKRFELTGSIEGVQPDQLAGWLPDLRAFFPNLYLGLSDPIWIGSTGRVSFEQDTSALDAPGTRPVDTDLAMLLAHEIGHNLGLRHPNTPDANGANDPKTDWPYPDANIREPGLDPVNQVLYESTKKKELMSYCDPPGSRIWISAFSYDKLLKGKLKPRAEAQQLPARLAAASEVLLVSGWASIDGTSHLDPVYRVQSAAAAEAADSGGNYCIRLSGAAGKIADTCFTLAFKDHRHAPLTTEYFIVKVPMPSGVTKISLVQGESELTEMTASSNPPAVSITAPAAGSTLQGATAVRWSGSDPDGDALTYSLVYSPDNGSSWIPVDLDLAASESTIQTAEMAAGSQILIRVIASDGFDNAIATVGPLTIVAQPVIDAAKSMEFGSVDLGQNATLNLHVANRGEKTLTIQSATSSSPEFLSTTSFPLAIGARGDASIAVKFAPSSVGGRSATLTLACDDPATPTTIATLVGNGLTRADLAATPASLDFGAVASGSSKELPTSIRNSGSGLLTISRIVQADSQFRVTSPTAPLTIAPGASATFVVTFTPASLGSQFGAIDIISDSPVHPLFEISATGSGSGTFPGPGCSYSWSPNFTPVEAAGGQQSNSFIAPKGCAWTATAGASWIVLKGATTGTGTGTVSYEVKPNSGGARSGSIAVGGATFAVRQKGVTPYVVVPAAASLQGNFNSFFRTGLQLHNPGSSIVTGSITFHPMAASGTAEDPTISYSIGPGTTQSIPDLLPAMGWSGIGTIDITPRIGAAPIGIARVYNDAGAAGTSGMGEDLVVLDGALEKNDRAVLIAPPEPSRARYNIGARSLGYGANINITVRDRNGATRKTLNKVFPLSYFVQQKAEDFLGIALLESDSITFDVADGSAIVYGAANDNTTQDPTAQFARPVSGAASAGQTRIIPVVGSVRGSAGSNFRTALQIHNASDAQIAGKIVFHRASTSAAPGDPSITYELQPRATTYYSDLVQTLGVSGLGSVDLTSTTGALPVTMARVFNDAGAAGTSGLSEDAVRTEDALQAGETGVLFAPPDPSVARFNLGLRTLSQGVAITITQRDRSGLVVRTVTRSYGPNYFEQVGSATILGASPGPGDSLTVRVDSGSAIVYGTTNDNVTNDPTLQIARKR